MCIALFHKKSISVAVAKKDNYFIGILFLRFKNPTKYLLSNLLDTQLMLSQS